ncbi:tripartite tricarboxylate transporter TctB family protein [Pseudonocardia nigra]|uniref:tripartite tricarboxylate transporter TctB family protein n=1 Tax=Pseudonocardia nigra TaxID=1921578 RepID=UPI001C5F2E6C|nr:tripartite tricarboxylate transporter TctB family protein [Pseudonocardia nigra]
MDRSTAGSRRGPRGQLFRLGPLVVLAVGVAAVVGAIGLSLGELTAPGPGLWPFIVSVVLTGSALALLLLDDPEDYERWTGGTARIVAGIAGLGVFIAVFEVVGFLLPAFLMLLLWLRIFGRESWRWSLGLALAGSIGMYLLFDQALGVPFPDDVIAGLVGA